MSGGFCSKWLKTSENEKKNPVKSSWKRLKKVGNFTTFLKIATNYLKLDLNSFKKLLKKLKMSGQMAENDWKRQKTLKSSWKRLKTAVVKASRKKPSRVEMGPIKLKPVDAWTQLRENGNKLKIINASRNYCNSMPFSHISFSTNILMQGSLVLGVAAPHHSTAMDRRRQQVSPL